MRKAAACLLLGILLTACVSVHYVPYTGDQNHWKPNPRSDVDYSLGVIPVYSGNPTHHFTVIGSVTASERETSLKTLTWFCSVKAKQMGADALVIAHEGHDYVKGTGGFNPYYYPSHTGPSLETRYTRGVYDNEVVLWAIKWK